MKKSILLVLGLLFLMCVVLPCEARIIYVDQDFSGVGDGSSWASPLPVLTFALQQAREGDEIRVAAGVYVPVFNPILGSSFRIPSGVRLKGGYAGFQSENPDLRDFSRYATVLSGDMLGNDTVFQWIYPTDSLSTDPSSDMLDYVDRQDNVNTVVVIDEADPNTLLSGVTIMSGHADGEAYEYDYTSSHERGGGLCIIKSSATIEDCVLMRNLARDKGGALYVFNGSPIIRRCTFSRNYCVDCGGAISLQGSGARIEACVFHDNITSNEGAGGAIHITNESTVIQGCTFRTNWSGKGGALANMSSEIHLTVSDCLFSDNEVHTSGGALWHRSSKGDITYLNCLFLRNSVIYRDGGAGILYGSEASFINCVFNSNKCLGIGNGGALRSLDGAHVNVINCTFANQAAEIGVDLAAGNEGEEIYSNFEIRNSILYDAGEKAAETLDDISGLRMKYNNIMTTRAYNFYLDPQFVDPDGVDDIPGTEDDNFQLQNNSPCIDAGSNDYVSEGEGLVDLAGAPRLQDHPYVYDVGFSDGRPVVDIGAYEFTFTRPE